MKTYNYKAFPFTAFLACMLMISSFAADRQIKNSKPSLNCSKKIKIKEGNSQSSPMLATYILQIWRM